MSGNRNNGKNIAVVIWKKNYTLISNDQRITQETGKLFVANFSHQILHTFCSSQKALSSPHLSLLLNFVFLISYHVSWRLHLGCSEILLQLKPHDKFRIERNFFLHTYLFVKSLLCFIKCAYQSSQHFHIKS